MLYTVHLVVLILEEKRWRYLLGKMLLHILLESKAFLVNCKVSPVGNSRHQSRLRGGKCVCRNERS